MVKIKILLSFSCSPSASGFPSSLSSSRRVNTSHYYYFNQYDFYNLHLKYLYTLGQYLGSGLIDMWRISPIFQVKLPNIGEYFFAQHNLLMQTECG